VRLLQSGSLNLLPRQLMLREAIPMTRTGDKMTAMILLFLLTFAVPGAEDTLLAAKLQPETVKAWDQYLAWADAKVSREVNEKGKFLIGDRLSPNDRAKYDEKLRSGNVYLAKMSGVVPGGAKFEVPNGAIHHFWGAVLVPGVKLPGLLASLQDYDHHAGRFQEVERSRLLSRNGNTYKFNFRLKRSVGLISATYSTDQECTYHPVPPDREWSRSIATRIAQIADAGKPDEKEKTIGDDSGYLWRMMSWWRFKEVPEGVIVECESATLSRGIPFKAAFGPFVEGFAQDSVNGVLSTVRGYGKVK
jgi:hypothetical protein